MTLEIITHDRLAPVTHGFFTRKGGASSGVFAGLNCGGGSSDQMECVTINRSRVADAMGVDALVGVHQVHSADVAVVNEFTTEKPEADAIVTATPGIAISILTADCQPVLFADTENGVVGAAHAGWKGALSGVLDRTVDAMLDLGAKRDSITAIIGPSISQRAYEVGQEFFDKFADENPEYTRFFVNGTKDGKYMFDLPAFGLMRLRDAGVGHAEWTRHCTYSDPERFYSFRRTTHNQEADYGRLISVIRL